MASQPNLNKLEVRKLRKTFGELVALHGDDLDLADGEFLTLLGPSGSGKTTLLLAIAGLNEPDDGEIWIDGQLATHLPAFERDIGMVFQNYALFPHMTVFDNIAFALKMRKWSRDQIQQAVERVLEIVQLPQVADRYPRQLSGGQQQRIALARAMVYEPSVILMDEPLGALDKKLRDQLQLEIKRLHQELNMAVLYVTHDQGEALVMSDRICLMRDGQIEQLGTPDELYFRPRTIFAADFLGEANMLSGEAVGREDDYVVVDLADGTRVRGVSDHELTRGQAVRVMVRPEIIRLLGEGEDAENILEARLKEVVMNGSTTQNFFTTAVGWQIIVESLTSEPADRAAVGGKSARLGWATQRAVVLPDS